MSEDMLTNGPIWKPYWAEESPFTYEPTVTYTDYENIQKTLLDGGVVYKNYKFNPDINAFDIDMDMPYIDENGVPIAKSGFSKEDIPEMKVEESRVDITDNYRYAVACHNHSDLSPERILKSLSIMKSKLMMECMPIRVEKIECKMSPMVKSNIINAYRKVSMYGKKTPFVACFDDYGRRLPDEIQIDTIRGMDLKIVDPKIYGDNYLVFETIIPRRKKKDDAFIVKRDPYIFYE